MANMTAEQRQNADNVMEGTMTTWAGMWDAINLYAEIVDMPKLHWSVKKHNG